MIKRSNVAAANKAKRVIKASKTITAAEGDEEDDLAEDNFDMDDVDIEDISDDDTSDKIDDLADDIDELSDAVDDVEQDDVDIAVLNNIEDHYIAECESCQGVFISAVIHYQDQAVDKITGKCPLCGKDTDQYLKWVIKAV